MKNLKTLLVKEPLKLDCGRTIENFPIAYETYGELNEKKDRSTIRFSFSRFNKIEEVDYVINCLKKFYN